MRVEEDVQNKLVDAQEVSQLLSLSKRQVFRLNSSGDIPASMKVGGSVRWSLKELNNWMDAKAPTRDEWERMKGGQN